MRQLQYVSNATGIVFHVHKDGAIEARPVTVYLGDNPATFNPRIQGWHSDTDYGVMVIKMRRDFGVAVLVDTFYRFVRIYVVDLNVAYDVRMVASDGLKQGSKFADAGLKKRATAVFERKLIGMTWKLVS